MELTPPLLIIVIAASGYCFCNWCTVLRYDVLRDSGQRLYLTAALLDRLSSEAPVDEATITKLDEFRIVIPRSCLVSINLSVNLIHNTISNPQSSF